MQDINKIRLMPEAFLLSMKKRNFDVDVTNILELDLKLKESKTLEQDLRRQKNELVKAIAQKRIAGHKTDTEELETKSLQNSIDSIKTKLETLEEDLISKLALIPNSPHVESVEGKDESDNQEIRRFGQPRLFDFTILDHVEIGEKLRILDLAGAAKISGSRFAIYKGALAKLDRALANFMLDINTKEYGHIEMTVPTLTLEKSMYWSGQLPKFTDESFKTTDGYRLIPTSEVSLVSYFSNEILSQDELPIRLTSYSQCFRSEAGSSGKDTRGIIRQHQFGKVELVSIVEPEKSDLELERLVSIAEEILKRLELPYRVVKLCTGDLGFCAAATYDLEVWFPSQNTYREISSCSNCHDFQSRRMNARYKNTDAKMVFPHTLNGSALAIGRTIAALIENFQSQNGDIQIPSALQPYCDFKSITKQ